MRKPVPTMNGRSTGGRDRTGLGRKRAIQVLEFPIASSHPKSQGHALVP
jgi:hypothetical protein